MSVPDYDTAETLVKIVREMCDGLPRMLDSLRDEESFLAASEKTDVVQATIRRIVEHLEDVCILIRDD